MSLVFSVLCLPLSSPCCRCRSSTPDYQCRHSIPRFCCPIANAGAAKCKQIMIRKSSGGQHVKRYKPVVRIFLRCHLGDLIAPGHFLIDNLKFGEIWIAASKWHVIILFLLKCYLWNDLIDNSANNTQCK